MYAENEGLLKVGKYLTQLLQKPCRLLLDHPVHDYDIY